MHFFGEYFFKNTINAFIIIYYYLFIHLLRIDLHWHKFIKAKGNTIINQQLTIGKIIGQKKKKRIGTVELINKKDNEFFFLWIY